MGLRYQVTVRPLFTRARTELFRCVEISNACPVCRGHESRPDGVDIFARLTYPCSFIPSTMGHRQQDALVHQSLTTHAFTVAHQAVYLNHVDLLQHLISSSTPPPPPSLPSSSSSSSYNANSLQSSRELSRRRVLFNMPNENGETPLHFAACHGRYIYM